MSTNKTVSPYHWPNRACLKSLDRLIAGAKVKNIIGSLDAYAKLEHELKVHFLNFAIFPRNQFELYFLVILLVFFLVLRVLNDIIMRFFKT